MKIATMYHNTRKWLKNAFSKITKKHFVICAVSAALIVAMAVVSVFSVSLSIKAVTSERIIAPKEALELEDVDYILVLGAGLRPDGSPSDMLHDRLLTGVGLLQDGCDGRLLMSGDNSGEHYNEVGAMNDYALSNGVESEFIVLDNHGFSTYESIYRAKNEFGAEKVIIITQGYHLHRALYISRELGLEAYGVSADVRTYRGQLYRDAREHLARFKDFWQCLVESGK